MVLVHIIIKSIMRNVWDEVWNNDVYSDKYLREVKAEYKISKLLQLLNITEKQTVIDIGCGGGYITKELYLRTKAKIYAIDSSTQAIELARDYCKNIPVKIAHADAASIPCKNDFCDIALCVGLLEHVKDIDKALSEIVRVLKNGGYLYVVSSNRFSFMYEQRLIRQLIHRWPYGYQKNWRQKKLIKKLTSYGFSTEHIEILPSVGNFKFIDLMDSLFSTKNRKRGRYIYYLGRLCK